nr:transposase [Nocardia miyunensis]
MLRELNATGGRKVFDDAPTGFVPTKWRGYLDEARKSGSGRTIYAAKYLSDPDYRRKISRQLNKGESLHALRRDLLYAHEGMIRARHLESQTEQAWCLTLATNAVIAWTAEYYGLAVEQMRREGWRIDDEVLAHVSPAHSENINFFRAIEVDIDAELAQLGPTGYRQLRVRDTLF